MLVVEKLSYRIGKKEEDELESWTLEVIRAWESKELGECNSSPAGAQIVDGRLLTNVVS